MSLLPYLEHAPEIAPNVRVDESAVLVGKVSVASPAVIEASAVLRGDQSWIGVGPNFRMGQRATIHTEYGVPTQIGSNVWLGDDAVVHACTVGDGVCVEDGGLVLTGSTVGAGSIVAADSLVPEGATFEPNSYISGTPGRRLRDTTEAERAETVERLRAACSAQ